MRRIPVATSGTIFWIRSRCAQPAWTALRSAGSPGKTTFLAAERDDEGALHGPRAYGVFFRLLPGC
jgi:hypothetical protein